MVNTEDIEPADAGVNITLILHFFFGSSCIGQFEASDGKLNTCGLVPGSVNATGLAKVIGGPLLAGLLSVNVAFLVLPGVTLPKFLNDGLTFRDSGTAVGIDVGVGVAVAIGVAVAVAVAVLVAVAPPDPLSGIVWFAFAALS